MTHDERCCCPQCMGRDTSCAGEATASNNRMVHLIAWAMKDTFHTACGTDVPRRPQSTQRQLPKCSRCFGGREDWATIDRLCSALERLKAAAIANAYDHGETVDSEWGCCHTAQELRQGYRSCAWEEECEPLPAVCAGLQAARQHLSALGVEA